MNHVVKAYECNWKGELSLSHVVGIMMLASRKQERSLAHPDLIYQKGLSWIVIQNQLTVNRLPKLEEEISISPYFLAQYIEHLDLYKRNFLNGKFAIYYQVLEEENLIRIIHFRSNKQKPL